MKPRDFENYVGIPWLEGGRTRAGVDCWGLFRLVYGEVLGVELPSYSEDYEDALDREVIRKLMDGNRDAWVQVPEPEPGDGVVFHVAGRPHVGIVIGNGLVLHIEKGAGAVIERFDGMRMAQMLDGFYRYTP